MVTKEEFLFYFLPKVTTLQTLCFVIPLLFFMSFLGGSGVKNLPAVHRFEFIIQFYLLLNLCRCMPSNFFHLTSCSTDSMLLSVAIIYFFLLCNIPWYEWNIFYLYVIDGHLCFGCFAYYKQCHLNLLNYNCKWGRFSLGFIHSNGIIRSQVMQMFNFTR